MKVGYLVRAIHVSNNWRGVLGIVTEMNTGGVRVHVVQAPSSRQKEALGTTTWFRAAWLVPVKRLKDV